MIGIEWRIARRYMRGRTPSGMVSLITFIATAGVVVGVGALVIVMGVMSGLQTELRDRILIASPHLQIYTYGGGLRIDDWRRALDVIRENEHVVAAQPHIISAGLINAGSDFAEGVYVMGLPPDTAETPVIEIDQYFSRGDLGTPPEDPSAFGGIILGQRVADRLGVFPGDLINVTSPAGSRYNRAVGAIVPRTLQFEVTGTFNTGMYEYDQNYVVMSLAAAQGFAGLDTAVSGIQVRVDDPWRATEIGDSLVASLGLAYRAVDWQTQNAGLFSALKLEKLGMALILLLIVIVAAFNIVSMLTMVVADKTREIGILRAMGLSAAKVRTVFVLQGAFIGTAGTIIGGVIGVAVAYIVDKYQLISIAAEVYFIDHLPVRIDLIDVGLIVGAAVAVATLATIGPARQAAGFDPVEAIRHS